MLVLTRRAEEEIVIDGHIRVKVLSNHQGKVRLGISAPDDVRIIRAELSDDPVRDPRSRDPRSHDPRTIECLTPLWEDAVTPPTTHAAV